LKPKELWIHGAQGVWEKEMRLGEGNEDGRIMSLFSIGIAPRSTRQRCVSRPLGDANSSLGWSLLALLIALLFLGGCGESERKQVYFDRGLESMARNDYVHARLEFKNALQIDARDAAAWYWLGEAEAGRQNWNAAFTAYSKAIELDSAQIQARVKRAKLLTDANQLEKARADVEAILAADPRSPDGLVLRASLEAREGDLDAAAGHADAALAVDANHPEALLLLAGIDRHRQDLAGAKRLLARGVEAHPDDKRMRLSLSAVLQELGEVSAAREQLERLIAMDPGELGYAARLAGFLTKEGDTSAARKVLDGAIEANPDRVEAKLLLAEWVRQQQGAESAMELLEGFISDRPEARNLSFALAELKLKSGDAEGAESVYRGVIEREGLEPGGLAARNQLASLMIAQKRIDEAALLVDEVLGASVRDADALQARAIIKILQKEPGKAIADLRDLLQFEPGSVRALILLAKAHVMLDEVALAQDALEQAVDAAPSEPQAYLELAQLKARAGDMQGASSTLQRFLQRVPDDAQVQAALARVQLTQQDWGAIEATADRILASQPEHPLGYYLKGLVLQHAGSYQESVRQFETALEKRPNAADPILGITRSYMALKQPERAEERLRKLLLDQPANAAGLLLLGEVYAATDRFDEARAQFDQLMVLYPRLPTAYVRLADLLLMNGRISDGISTLESGVNATGRNALLLFKLGASLQEAGRYEEAIAAYDEVLKSNPQADGVANNLAILLVSVRPEDPESLSRALELTERFEGSSQGVFLDTLGWVQFRNGRFDQALANLEKAEQLLDPPPAELQYHLGMIYAHLGRTEKAKSTLMAAISANVSFPGIEEAREKLGNL